MDPNLKYILACVTSSQNKSSHDKIILSEQRRDNFRKRLLNAQSRQKSGKELDRYTGSSYQSKKTGGWKRMTDDKVPDIPIIYDQIKDPAMDKFLREKFQLLYDYDNIMDFEIINKVSGVPADKSVTMVTFYYKSIPEHYKDKFICNIETIPNKTTFVRSEHVFWMLYLKGIRDPRYDYQLPNDLSISRKSPLLDVSPVSSIS